jgi:tubulin beta
VTHERSGTVIDMRETVSVHVGGCGVRLGGEFWTALRNEREWADGARIYEDAHYSEGQDGRLVPRALFVDLDDGPIDALRASSIGDTFSPYSFISDGSAVHRSFGDTCALSSENGVIEEALDAIRRQLERCDGVDAVQFTHSLSGATGAGVTATLLAEVDVTFPIRALRTTTSVLNGWWPESLANASPVEPYNVCYGMHQLIEHSQATFMFSNDALAAYDRPICSKEGTVARRANAFRDWNRVVTRTTSAVAALSRYPCGEHRTSLQGLCTNLIPWPRRHFISARYLECESAAETVSLSSSVMTGSVVPPDSWHEYMFNTRDVSQHRLLHRSVHSTAIILRGADTRGVLGHVSDLNANTDVTHQHIPPFAGSASFATSRVADNPERKVTGVVLSGDRQTAYVMRRYHELARAMMKRQAFFHTFDGTPWFPLAEVMSNIADAVSEYEFDCSAGDYEDLDDGDDGFSDDQ